MFVNYYCVWGGVQTADAETMESTGPQNQCALWEMKSTVKAHFKPGRLNLNSTPFNLLQSTRLQGLEIETFYNLKVAHVVPKLVVSSSATLIKSHRVETCLPPRWARCFVKISTHEL